MLYLNQTYEFLTGGYYSGNTQWNKKHSEIDNCFKLYQLTQGEAFICDEKQTLQAGRGVCGSGGRRRLPEYRRRRCFHCRKSQLQAISSMAKRSGSVFRHVRRTGVFHAVICRMAGQTDSFSRISIRLSALASTGFRNFLRASSSPSPRRHQSRPSSRMETGE